MSLTPQNELFGSALAFTEGVAVVASEAEFEALLLAATRLARQDASREIGGRERNAMEFPQTKGRRT